MIVIAILASRSFVSVVSVFLPIFGYYVGASVSCFMLEWLYFRCSHADTMDPALWDDAAALPSGIPAIISVLVSWALIIPKYGYCLVYRTNRKEDWRYRDRILCRAGHHVLLHSAPNMGVKAQWRAVQPAGPRQLC